MRLIQSGSATLLQVDRNGGGDSYTTLLTLENTRANRFTANSFDGYAPVAAAPAPASEGPAQVAGSSTEASDWLIW